MHEEGGIKAPTLWKYGQLYEFDRIANAHIEEGPSRRERMYVDPDPRGADATSLPEEMFRVPWSQLSLENKEAYIYAHSSPYDAYALGIGTGGNFDLTVGCGIAVVNANEAMAKDLEAAAFALMNVLHYDQTAMSYFAIQDRVTVEPSRKGRPTHSASFMEFLEDQYGEYFPELPQLQVGHNTSRMFWASEPVRDWLDPFRVDIHWNAAHDGPGVPESYNMRYGPKMYRAAAKRIMATSKVRAAPRRRRCAHYPAPVCAWPLLGLLSASARLCAACVCELLPRRAHA